MSEWIKKYGWVLLIIVVTITAPFVINWVILQPQRFEVVGDGTHWLGFWATYISAIASFAMVFITWMTLRQMQLQWNEEHRARLIFSIDAMQGIYVLKIRNVGKSDAYKVSIKFNDDFIKCILADSIRETYEKLQTRSFSLESEKTRYLYISSTNSSKSSTHTYGNQSFSNTEVNNWIENNKDQEVIITGSYCDRYQINETLKLSEIMIDGALRIRDDLTVALESINKGSVSPNNVSPLYTIQKSLDVIAKKIDKFKVESE